MLMLACNVCRSWSSRILLVNNIRLLCGTSHGRPPCCPRHRFTSSPALYNLSSIHALRGFVNCRVLYWLALHVLYGTHAATLLILLLLSILWHHNCIILRWEAQSSSLKEQFSNDIGLTLTWCSYFIVFCSISIVKLCATNLLILQIHERLMQFAAHSMCKLSKMSSWELRSV